MKITLGKSSADKWFRFQCALFLTNILIPIAVLAIIGVSFLFSEILFSIILLSENIYFLTGLSALMYISFFAFITICIITILRDFHRKNNGEKTTLLDKLINKKNQRIFALILLTVIICTSIFIINTSIENIGIAIQLFVVFFFYRAQFHAICKNYKNEIYELMTNISIALGIFSINCFAVLFALIIPSVLVQTFLYLMSFGILSFEFTQIFTLILTSLAIIYFAIKNTVTFFKKLPAMQELLANDEKNNE